MASLPFDPSESVAFDLNRGHIALSGSSERVLVPADALLTLCQSVSRDQLVDFGRRLGTEAGRRAAERLGDPAAASIESVVDHLGGDLALFGLGSLGLERWGRALVLVVDGSPFGAPGDPLVAEVLQGALQRAFGRDSRVVPLTREDQRARFLVASPAGGERVQSWLSEGVSWGEALARLEQGKPRGEA